jgi:hypothetical protein
MIISIGKALVFEARHITWISGALASVAKTSEGEFTSGSDIPVEVKRQYTLHFALVSWDGSDCRLQFEPRNREELFAVIGFLRECAVELTKKLPRSASRSLTLKENPIPDHV